MMIKRDLAPELIQAAKKYPIVTISGPRQSAKTMSRDPLIGSIFENLVILELVKSRFNKGLNPNIYFYRDSNGLEVDVLYKQGAALTPIEIKSPATFNKIFSKGLKKFQALTGLATKGYIVYSGDFIPDTEHYRVLNFLNTADVFK